MAQDVRSPEEGSDLRFADQPESLLSRLAERYPEVLRAIEIFEVSMAEYSQALEAETRPVIVVSNASHGGVS